MKDSKPSARRGHSPLAVLCLVGLALAASAFRPGTFVGLTPEERQWMRDNPTVRVAVDPRFPPVEFYQDHETVPSGIAPDFISQLERILGLHFEYVSYDSWEHVLAAIRAGEVDMLSAAQSTPERREYLRFTSPYLNLQTVIIKREGTPAPLTMNDLVLQHSSVAVVSGYSVEDYLREEYPDLQLVTVESASEGLRAVALGRVDAMVINLAVASFFIRQDGLTNLQVVGEADDKVALAMAVRNDLPILRDILDKALNSISIETRERIHDHWVRLAVVSPGIRPETLRMVLGIFAAILIVLILLWNRMLKKQVVRRTRELEQELVERKKAQEACFKSMEREQEMSRLLESGNLKLLELNEERAEFLKLAGERLNKPLCSLVEQLAALRQSVPAEHAEALESMESQASRVSRRLADFILFDALKAGQIPIRLQSLNLREFVPNALDAQKLQTVELRLDKAELGKVVGDPEGMRIMLEKFFEAVQEMADPGSKVTIESLDEGGLRAILPCAESQPEKRLLPPCLALVRQLADLQEGGFRLQEESNRRILGLKLNPAQ